MSFYFYTKNMDMSGVRGKEQHFLKHICDEIVDLSPECLRMDSLCI